MAREIPLRTICMEKTCHHRADNMVEEEDTKEATSSHNMVCRNMVCHNMVVNLVDQMSLEWVDLLSM